MLGRIMTNKLFHILVVATACSWVFPSAVHADRYAADWERPDASDWPLAVIERPLTLTRNMLELSGNTVRLDMSNEEFGRPLSIAPDLHFGITSRFTFGIVHDVGVCVLGGCGYADGGVALRIRAYEGTKFSVAVTGKVTGDLSAFGTTAGLLARVRLGQSALVLAPAVYAGLHGDPGRGNGFEIPVHFQLQLGKRIMGYVATGLTEAEFADFGSTAKVPLGFGGSLTLSSRLDLGGELYIRNYVGPSPGKNTERTLSLRLAVRI